MIINYINLCLNLAFSFTNKADAAMLRHIESGFICLGDCGARSANHHRIG